MSPDTPIIRAQNADLVPCAPGMTLAPLGTVLGAMITTFSDDSTEVVERSRLERLQQLGGRQLVRKMIDLFNSHTAERVETIRASDRADELREAEAAAHSLKTSAGNLGATRLYQLAMALEASAAHGELGAFLALRPQLLDEFARASDALARVRTGLQEHR